MGGDVFTSRSLRARGLKSDELNNSCILFDVALFTGAWIEIKPMPYRVPSVSVALFTGAWIEMGEVIIYKNKKIVALFTGAWIEIPTL